jgi:hypothetical protein
VVALDKVLAPFLVAAKRVSCSRPGRYRLMMRRMTRCALGPEIPNDAASKETFGGHIFEQIADWKMG